MLKSLAWGALRRFFSKSRAKSHALFCRESGGGRATGESSFRASCIEIDKNGKKPPTRAQRWAGSVYHIEKHHYFIKKRYVVR
ncbi:MAG: hypothetical protein ACR65T_17210 [Methylocystis sp.]|uniref:hypothetical protein n=1 Tax=Methylocystis sp. TaxID=1911079 RepID=UPI003DA2BAEE